MPRENTTKLLDWNEKAFLAGVAIILVALHCMQNHLWFRDFSVIWEAAYRLSLGQRPYVDFGMPMGPGSLLVPWLTFKILGPSFTSMAISSIVIGSLSLFSFALALRLCEISGIAWFAGVFLYGIFHLGQLKYPWYNSTALCFEMLSISAMLASRQALPRKRLLWTSLSAFACIACVFTKQDYAAGCCAIVGALCVLTAIERRQFSVVFQFGTAMLLSLSLWLAWLWTASFRYWFNYGQSPHLSRLKTVSHEFWNFWPAEDPIQVIRLSLIVAILFGLIGVAPSVFSKKLKFHLGVLEWDRCYQTVFCLGLILQCHLTAQTSGLFFLTGNYYVAPCIAYLLIQTRSAPFLMKFAAILLSLSLWWLSPDTNVYADLASYWSHQVTNFQGKVLRGNLVQGKSHALPYVDREWLPAKTVAGISSLKSLMPPSSHSCSVLNMTELTVLAAELGYTPCPGLPLWYHSTISLFPREFQALLEDFKTQRYELVLIQWTHEGPLPFYNQYLNVLNEHYRKVMEFPAPRADAPIFVYVPIRRG